MLEHKGVKVNVHAEDKRGNVFTLCAQLVLWYANKRVCVPRGFESDGASVPRFFWRYVFPPGDPAALRASIGHDYIYRTHPDGWKKSDADKMFLGTMLVDGVSPKRAYRAYLGVKYFGWLSWWKGRKKK